MSTLQEIEAAIKALPQAEREKLVADLPAILPELDGDAQWDRISRDNLIAPDRLSQNSAISFKRKPEQRRTFFPKLSPRILTKTREVTRNSGLLEKVSSIACRNDRGRRVIKSG